MELPSIRQLECLVAVSEALNFRQAAACCSITQPALSAQIRQLETLLGVALFERDRRRVLITPAGRVAAASARSLLAQARDFVEAARTHREPLVGSLHVGVIPTVAPYVLPAAFDLLRAEHPDLRAYLHEDQTHRLVRDLGRGDLDVLLLALEADLGDVRTLAILEDPFLLAVAPGHPLAKRKRVREEDLASEEVLLLDDGHCLRKQALEICRRGGAVEHGDFKASSLSTLVQMVAGGMGVTLLPRLALDVEVGSRGNLRLIPFSPRVPRRTIGLAWRPSSPCRGEFELLGDVIRRALG